MNCSGAAIWRYKIHATKANPSQKVIKAAHVISLFDIINTFFLSFFFCYLEIQTKSKFNAYKWSVCARTPASHTIKKKFTRNRSESTRAHRIPNRKKIIKIVFSNGEIHNEKKKAFEFLIRSTDSLRILWNVRRVGKEPDRLMSAKPFGDVSVCIFQRKRKITRFVLTTNARWQLLTAFADTLGT